ncbi:MAG: ribonuclease HII, partial [Clostridiales bacterium]|nr:ribonuclease HII [Clostridiales bacterium]
ERLERDIAKLAEMKAHEDELRSAGYRYIAGIDEVGRGPLAGPVYAACVVLPDDFDVIGVNDSKKLSAKRREELSEVIKERAVAYGIGIADNNEIDEINILEATKNAMRRAIEACNEMLKARGDGDGSEGDGKAQINMLLIDAVKLGTDIPSESIIKGDEKSLSIAAASIVAKVARDSYMVEMDEVYPGYDFAGNKGYGTAKHYDGLRTLGYTPIHRRSFLRKFEEEQTSGIVAWGGTDGAGDGADERKKNLAKKKVYAVKKGRTTGIFTSWDDCKAQVDGFPGAEYKSFADPQDAMAYLGISPGETAAGAAGAAGSGKDAEPGFPPGVRAYVDGSYDEAAGRFSCGAVMVRTAEDGTVTTRELSRAFDEPELAKQRNVAGEIMGAKMAIDFCLERGIPEVSIYHDYEGVGKWADGKWKANNPLTQGYRDYVAKARTRMKIEFCKVKAHAGNKYNEMADKLAKEALGM